MDYKKIYDAICERGQTTERHQQLKDNGTYFELHHVVPRCMGGTDDISNLTKLTAREHFICHHLLYKIYSKNITADKSIVAKLCRAFFRMTCSNKKQGRKLILNSYQYQEVREACSLAMKLHHPWDYRSEESKQKFYEYARQDKSEIHKQRISDSNKGYRNFTNVKTGENIRIKIGTTRYEEVSKSDEWVTSAQVYSKTQFRNKITGEIISIDRNNQQIRNDPNWEYWSTGFAAYRNKTTGETCVLSADDPRRTNGEWMSTSAGKRTHYHKDTFEIKTFWDDDEVDETVWIPMHQGKRLYRNKITGEKKTILFFNPILKSGEWEPCGELRTFIMFNWRTRETVVGDKFEYQDKPDWIHIIPNRTKFVNINTLELRKVASVEDVQKLGEDWWPNSTNTQTLMINIIGPSVVYVDKLQETETIRRYSTLVSIVNVATRQYLRVPVFRACNLLKQGWIKLKQIPRRNQCTIFRSRKDGKLYFLEKRDIIGNTNYEYYYAKRGILE